VRTPIHIGLVGIGKIARDQHLPALARSDAFELVAAVSRHHRVEAIETFGDLDAMLASARALRAVSICTPPQGRHALARSALDAGLHVMLEKPPGASVGEVLDLERRARDAGLTLFTTWHSREAAGVGLARAWLLDRTVKSVRATWKEDVGRWHPGQDWIFDAGGFGVLDPGINALSILTCILPQRLILNAASLSFPSNRQAPIAAELEFLHARAPVHLALDFRQQGPQRWDIEIETDRGTLRLSDGGQRLHIDGVERINAQNHEYANLYARFSHLIATGASDVDVTPLQHVADAFLLGHRVQTAAFHF
jgi:predicted dehydrogenase